MFKLEKKTKGKYCTISMNIIHNYYSLKKLISIDQEPCNCLCGPNAINEDPCVKKNKKGKQGEKDDKNNSGDKDKKDGKDGNKKDGKDGKEDGKSGFASASAVGKTTNNKRAKDANAKKETNKKPTNKKNQNLKHNEGESKTKCRKKSSIRLSKNGKKLMKDRLPNRFEEVRICDVMRVELEYRDICRWLVTFIDSKVSFND